MHSSDIVVIQANVETPIPGPQLNWAPYCAHARRLFPSDDPPDELYSLVIGAPALPLRYVLYIVAGAVTRLSLTAKSSLSQTNFYPSGVAQKIITQA